MKVAHFDCFSGISGDMTLGALIDAGVSVEVIRQGIDSLGLPVRLEAEKIRKGGFAATSVRIEAPDEHSHRHLLDIEEIVRRGALTEHQKNLALQVFRRLAEAEAAAHGMPLERVHFHEVGALDSIADIVGAAIGIDLLGVERITSRAVPTGNGMVKCAHGLMPIPAPGTAALLKGVPIAPTNLNGELTTPTGAAILTTIVNEWTNVPAMTIEQIGHGAGRKEFPEQPNILRLFVGTSETPNERDRICVLETNLDDLAPEVIGYCFELLFSAGAVDVFTTPIGMKKNRPGTMLTVLAPEPAVPVIEDILFRETGTLGIRRYDASRVKQQRRLCNVSTSHGPVRGKVSWREGRAPAFSPEYDDCARIARAAGLSLREVYEQAMKSYQTQGEMKPS